MGAQSFPQLQAVGETSITPFTAGGEPPPPLSGYTSLFKSTNKTTPRQLKLKEVKLVHGEPTITFDSSDIAAYIQDENLQFALLAKFSYGKPDMPDLRKIFPQQMGIKGECNLGLLDSRHILVRLHLHEDFISLYSRVGTNTLLLNNGKGIEFPFRIQRWTPKFNPKQETSIALAWISFPNLPVQFFAREALFSLASAIGTPLGVDKATNSQSRPNVARVKIEVDLLSSLPERIRLYIKEDGVDELQEFWQKVVYDRLPSYCTTCYHQGHRDEVCRWNIDQQTLVNNDGEKFQGDLRDKLNEKRKDQRAETTDSKGQQTIQQNGSQSEQHTLPTAGKQTGSLVQHQKNSVAVVGKKVFVPRKQHSNGTNTVHTNGTSTKVQDNDTSTGDAGAALNAESTGQFLNSIDGNVMEKSKSDNNGNNGWTVVTKRKPNRFQKCEQAGQQVTSDQLQQHLTTEPFPGSVNDHQTGQQLKENVGITIPELGQQKLADTSAELQDIAGNVTAHELADQPTETTGQYATRQQTTATASGEMQRKIVVIDDAFVCETDAVPEMQNKNALVEDADTCAETIGQHVTSELQNAGLSIPSDGLPENMDAAKLDDAGSNQTQHKIAAHQQKRIDIKKGKEVTAYVEKTTPTVFPTKLKGIRISEPNNPEASPHSPFLPLTIVDSPVTAEVLKVLPAGHTTTVICEDQTKSECAMGGQQYVCTGAQTNPNPTHAANSNMRNANNTKQMQSVQTGTYSTKGHNIDIFEQGEEDEILDSFFDSAARDADISPNQKTRAKNRKNNKGGHRRGKVYHAEVQREQPTRQAKNLDYSAYFTDC